MASTEEAVATTEVSEVVLDSPMEEKAVTDDNGGKSKKLKAKKVSTVKKPRNPPSHPPYLEMITEAITTLKERNGSSQYAIQKFIEEKQKHLPSNFRKLPLANLKKSVASGKLVKVKGSFKLPSKSESVLTSKPKSATTSKPKSGAMKSKRKVTAEKSLSKTTVTAKTKAKVKVNVVVEKPKSKKSAPMKVKVKVVSGGVKRKGSTEEKPKAKVAKTTVKSTPSKKSIGKPVKKTDTVKKGSMVKTVKAKSVKSPAKRAMSKRGMK